MSRIRTIKPEFFVHEGLSELSIEAHFLAAALLCYADDEGYFNANPKLVGAECFPLRDEYGTPTVSVTGYLLELSKQGYLRLGKGSDGRSYGQIINFSNHQVINKRKPSKIKDLVTQWDEYGTSPVHTPECDRPERNREQGTGKGKELKDLAESETKTAEKKTSRTIPEVTFDSANRIWGNITQQDYETWKAAYPAINIETELAKAASWLVSNPANQKSRYRKFLNGWFSRAQDRAPARSTQQPESADPWAGVRRV